MRAWSVAVLVLLAAPLVHADGEEVDREIARRHYEEGRRFYQANDYVGALKEFLQARQVMQVPALDFNIGRCQDRLEQLSDAIASYQRYVDATPPPADAPEVRERIRVLQARLDARPPAASQLTTPTEASPAAQPHRKRRYWIAGVVIGSVAVVALGVGLGVGLSSEAAPSPSLGTIRLMSK
jgi:tetratricopeptide (TPR) repeat protein